MVWFWTLFTIGAIFSFFIGKLPQYLGMAIVALIILRIAVIAFVFFIIGLLIFRPRYCCRRC